jgi:hypothetical protein
MITLAKLHASNPSRIEGMSKQQSVMVTCAFEDTTTVVALKVTPVRSAVHVLPEKMIRPPEAQRSLPYLCVMCEACLKQVNFTRENAVA